MHYIRPHGGLTPGIGTSLLRGALGWLVYRGDDATDTTDGLFGAEPPYPPEGCALAPAENPRGGRGGSSSLSSLSSLFALLLQG